MHVFLPRSFTMGESSDILGRITALLNRIKSCRFAHIHVKLHNTLSDLYNYCIASQDPSEELC